MRTHQSIIAETGATATAVAIFHFMPEGRWASPKALANTVQAWKREDKIPGEYWQAFKDAGLAQLDELAAASAAKFAESVAA